MNLVCINDLNKLELRGNENLFYFCDICSSTFPVKEGVVSFLKKKHDFYEGDYRVNMTTIKYTPKGKHFASKFPLWLINSGYPWYVNKFVFKGSTVLELGCGGGVNFFAENYKTVGLDFSHRALKNMVGKYEYCLMADALKIPLENESVDAVISSYFWEHIELNSKPKLLQECRRVLKPNGKIIFLYDIDSENPLIKYLKKKNENAYRDEFINKSHHWGFQSKDENLSLFNNSNFILLKDYILERTFLQSPSIYDKLKPADGLAGKFFSLLSSFFSRSPFFYVNTLAVRLIDSSVGRLFPAKWGRLHLIILKKK